MTTRDDFGLPDPRVGLIHNGEFLITERLGAGGMGVLYKATQTALGRTVAVKFLNRVVEDEFAVRRFQREAQAAAILKHPNTIDVIAFGRTESGSPYIVMEYIDGQELAEVMHHQFPLAPARIIRILKQVCLALDQAHEKNIIHRDLKPENIMLERRKNESDFVKVLDFGIAKIQDPERKGDRWQTLGGPLPGTPEYMAPEQARGETLDHRCDLYALGVIAYQLLTNRLPFTGASPAAIAVGHLMEVPRRPREIVSTVHPELEAIALRLLAKDRNARPTCAMEVYELLDGVAISWEPVQPATPGSPQAPQAGVRIPGAATQAAVAWAAELRRTLTNAYSSEALESGVRQAAKAREQGRPEDGRQMRLSSARKALDALLRSLHDRLNRAVSREERAASLASWDERAKAQMASPAFQSYRRWLQDGQAPSIGSIVGWTREAVDAGVPALNGTTGAALGLSRVSVDQLQAASKARNVLAHVPDYERPRGPDLGRASLWVTLGPADDPRLDVSYESLEALITVCEDICGRIAGTTAAG